MPKTIYFTKHALMQVQNQKTSKEEVETVIQKGLWKPAEKESLQPLFAFHLMQNILDDITEQKRWSQFLLKKKIEL